MSVKYPGMEFSQTNTETQKQRPQSSINQINLNHPPSEMSFNPFSPKDPSKTMYDNKVNSSSLAQSNIAPRENKTLETWHGSNEAKKERQIELTQQLMALQSQGYIKNVPKGQVTHSLEGHLSGYDSQLSPTFVPTQTLPQRSQPNSQVVVGDSKGFQSSFDVKQFDVTNAFSQTFDSMNNTAKAQQRAQQFDDSKGLENSSFRAHKDFLIRSNKNLPKGRPVSSSQVGQMRSTNEQFRGHEEEHNLEDTLHYDAFDHENHHQGKEVIERGGASLNPPPNTTEILSKVWDQVLIDLERKDVESAYERILTTGNIDF